MAFTNPFRKNQFNIQFARISTLLGFRTPAFAPALGPNAPDDGIEPLADNNGRLIIRLASDTGFIDAGNPLPVDAAIAVPPGGLDVNIISSIPLPVTLDPLRIFAPAGLPGDGPTYVPSVGRIYSAVGGRVIYSIYGYHDNPLACYFQLFDSAILPVSGATIPTIVMPLGAGPGTLLPEVLSNSNSYNSLSNGGFGNGIVVALSSTRAVFTAVGTAYLNAYVLIG